MSTADAALSFLHPAWLPRCRPYLLPPPTIMREKDSSPRKMLVAQSGHSSPKQAAVYPLSVSNLFPYHGGSWVAINLMCAINLFFKFSFLSFNSHHFTTVLWSFWAVPIFIRRSHNGLKALHFANDNLCNDRKKHDCKI